MRHTVLLRHSGRERRFVVHPSAVLREAQGHRLQVGRAALARQCNDRCRIDSRRQERADRHIGNHVVLDGFEHRIVDRDICVVGRVVERLCDGEVLHGLACAVRIGEAVRAGRNCANRAIHRERLGNRAAQKKSGSTRGIELFRHVPGGDQRPHLAGYAQRGPVVCVVERLDSVRVTRQKHPSSCCIPKREREHSAQVVEHLRASCGVKLQQHFRVGV